LTTAISEPSRKRAVTGSSIDFSPVADPDHEHEQQGILQITDDPIVADAILPITTHDRPFQRLSELMRVITVLDALGEKTQDPGSSRCEDFYMAERRMRTYDPAENATLDEMMTRHGVAR
jgi:hypothetical protein